MISRLAADPGVTIALALFAGVAVQVLAEHLKVPSIILLLAAGILLGPEVGGVILPASLTSGLHTIVGFGVSIILFEGAMNLRIGRLRKEARSIRRLVTLGVLITAAGGTVAAHLILGWRWRLAVLFGTLVTVTGPTVITPLVRRMRLQSRMATVLQAEGILADAIGAILAVVTLELVLAGEGLSLPVALVSIGARFAAGTISGAIGGAAIVLLLRFERLIPEALQRVFTLAMVVALFQISNAIISESAILAVIIAGLVVGNTSAHGLTELREFKEQLTVLLLGLLFILLSADVRLDDLRALGWPGVGLVAVLILVVRPVNVWASTAGSEVKPGEKLLLSVISPRGIVAAAVASFFAQTLAEEGIAGGPELRALVFMTIAITVIVAGTGGTALAGILGLKRSVASGYVILGAQPIGRTVARVMTAAGEEVILIDSNPQLCRAAETEGLRIIYGTGLSENVQMRAELDSRRGCICLTTNDEVNLLFARRARAVFKVPRAWVSIRSGRLNVTPKMVRQLDSRVLFGMPRNLDAWNQRIDRGNTSVQQWTAGLDLPAPAEVPEESFAYLPIAVQRGRNVVPYDDETSIRRGDVLQALVWSEQESKAGDDLRASGFEPVAAIALEPVAV